jgi:hypothetical protein
MCHCGIGAEFLMAAFFGGEAMTPRVLSIEETDRAALSADSVTALVTLGSLDYRVRMDAASGRITGVAYGDAVLGSEQISHIGFDSDFTEAELTYATPAGTRVMALDAMESTRPREADDKSTDWIRDESLGVDDCVGVEPKDQSGEERSAMGQLRLIALDQDAYRRKQGKYATAVELSRRFPRRLSDVYSCRVIGNYRFVLELSGDRLHFRVSATPMVYGNSGRISYGVVDGLVIDSADLQGRSLWN